MAEQLNLFSWLEGNYKIKKPIRLIEFFAGIGGQYKALSILGVPFESYKICEWAYNSIIAYNSIHIKDYKDYSEGKTKEELISYLNGNISTDYNKPCDCSKKSLEWLKTAYNNCIATNNLMNIMKVKGEDLQIVDTDKYEYVLTYSFPCFTADSLVLTRNGYKRICDVDYEDFVLSHDNKYHKVANIFNNGTHDIYKINAMGVDEIKTTINHKFYVREMFHKGHKWTRCFKQPIWKELRELTKNDYLGIAINQENRTIVSNKLPMQNEHFWWIIGRYLGDGWLRNQQGVIICCDKTELGEITYHLDKLDWHYNIVEERTVLKIHIPKKALSDFVSQFGNGAGNKHLTQDILDLPIHYLTPFIKGYISADGCFTNGLYKATSISRELIYGMAQCVAKVYKTPYRIYKVEPPKTKIIEDRLVNQNSWYQLVFKTENKKQDKAFYEGGYIWYPIKSIEYVGKDNVYDIEVEDSHSFTVQNTIVHNCQDLSLAGKRKGMSVSQANGGTRSGLLWEVERILTELSLSLSLPQILIMENVPEVVGSANINDFKKWELKLNELGYTNHIQIINAKDYGIPQNRKRCFMVSILNGNFEFGGKTPLKYKLKDLLEDSVDEKYYLSQKQLEQVIYWNAQQEPFETLGKEICPTITTRTGAYAGGMVLTSDYATEEEKQIGKDFLKIKEATKKGCKIAEEGDGIDISGRMKYHRGTVQKGISQTLLTSGDNVGVVVKVPLKRGYSVEVKEESEDTTEIDVIGNYSKSNYKATQIVGKGGVAPTVRENHGQVTAIIEKTLFSETEKKLFTEEGNIRRYIGSDIIDEFKEGQMATTTFPNGYGHGPRVHDESIALNTIDRPVVKVDLRIRKLTPKECCRLMGFEDKDYEAMKKAGLSDSAIYHCCGDSIVVPVLMMIFSKLTDEDEGAYRKRIADYVEKVKNE